MKNIRIGNDILLNFPIILENSTIEQIRKMNFKVFVMPSKPDVTESSTPETAVDKYKYRICDNHEMYNWKFDEFKKHHKHACELSHKIVEVEDDKYVFEAYFPAYHQHVLGKYDVIIFGNHKEVGQCVCDQKEFVNLVEHSEDADQVFTEDAEPILVLHPLMIEYGKLNEIEQAEKDRVRAEQYRVNNEISRDNAELLRRNNEQSRVLAEKDRNTKQGDLSKLITPTKTDLVSAINEAYNHGNGSGLTPEQEAEIAKISDKADFYVVEIENFSEEDVEFNIPNLATRYLLSNHPEVIQVGTYVLQLSGLYDNDAYYTGTYDHRQISLHAHEDGRHILGKVTVKTTESESELGDFVKVVDLTELQVGDTFECDGAFVTCVYGLHESHHRLTMAAMGNYRLDCFMHSLSEDNRGQIYSIIEVGESNSYTFKGWFVMMGGYGGLVSELPFSDDFTILQDIDGLDCVEWLSIITSSFGESNVKEVVLPAMGDNTFYVEGQWLASFGIDEYRTPADKYKIVERRRYDHFPPHRYSQDVPITYDGYEIYSIVEVNTNDWHYEHTCKVLGYVATLCKSSVPPHPILWKITIDKTTNNKVVTEVDTIDGKTAQEWFDYLEELFNHEYASKEELAQIESELGEFKPYVVQNFEYQNWNKNGDVVWILTDANECKTIVEKKYRWISVDNIILQVYSIIGDNIYYSKMPETGIPEELTILKASISKTSGQAELYTESIGETPNLQTEAKILTDAVNEVLEKTQTNATELTQIGSQVNTFIQQFEPITSEQYERLEDKSGIHFVILKDL